MNVSSNSLPTTLRARMAIPALLLLSTAPVDAAAQTVHRLEAGPATVAFGYYWSEAEPVLRVRSGDYVDVTTMITSSPSRLEEEGVAPERIPQALRDIYDRIPRAERGPGGHILTGPIYVEGAERGDVLEVRVERVDLMTDFGYNGCSGFIRDLCGDAGYAILELDLDAMTSEVVPGVTVPLRPFFGSMGVAPPTVSGRWSSNPPWIHGGNIDNREFVAGTSLFLPVHVDGALFEIGDGHAAQGHGEVNQTAIETFLEGRIQLVVHKDMSLEWPYAETPTHFITMGMHEDLTAATRIAVTQTAEFLAERLGISVGEGYRLTSIAVDLGITQLVDGFVGVHAMIPKTLFGG